MRMDYKFVENLREYKGYMITSGYEEKVIDKEFGKLAHVSRKDVLYKKKRENRKKDARKYRFVTAYEPAFPDIKIVLIVNVPTIIICIKAPPSLCKREEGMTLTLAPFYDF